MGENQKFDIDFKLQVVGKYELGKCGYKKLAREFGLSRDTVRDWCLNPKLHDAREMAKNKKINKPEHDLEYYKTAALFWETYAKNIEEELARQGKKKLVLKTMKDCLQKEPKTKRRKLCQIAGISKSTFYYNKNKSEITESDEKVLALINRLPEKVKRRGGSKTKSAEIKKRFGEIVNHKRMARICRNNVLLAHNRRRKFPKDYYKQQKENQKNLPKNILNRDFTSKAPLKKLCTDVSYFRTDAGWLYLSPVLDLCGRKIQCYVISNHNDEDLATKILDKMFGLGNLDGALLHSDQGVLYASENWRKRLKKNGIVQSMSRRGNCWDNACMEHFFGTLKVESGYDEIIKDRIPTESEVLELIDNFIDYYNNERIQKNLGWKTPCETAV